MACDCFVVCLRLTPLLAIWHVLFVSTWCLRGYIVGIYRWITQRKFKILFTKPKTRSMYSIKLINESFSKNLTKTISRLGCWKEERGFTPMTPFLDLFVSSYQIKTSPNDHALYGIHTNKKIQSKWSARTFFCHNNKTLYIWILFTKEIEEERGEKMALQKLATHYTSKP